MSRKPYKHGKRGTGRHVQLSERLQCSEAWKTLKPGPRALYVELKRRFNGSNNGRIYLSHRDAAAAINVNRNTVGAYFAELEARGFIRMTQAPHLGPSGIGLASVWALEELPTDESKTPGMAYDRWRQIRKPRTKKRTARPEKQDGSASEAAETGKPVLKIVT